MAVKESIPVTGQEENLPSREERDRAYSSGAGRKAEEQPTQFSHKYKGRHREDKKQEQKEESTEIETDIPMSAPIGLAMETTAESIDDDAPPGHG